MLRRAGNGAEQGRIVAASAPGIVERDDIHALLNFQVSHIIDGLNCVGGGPSIGPKKFSGDDGHVPVDAGHSQPILACGADRTGDMSAMIVICRIVDVPVVIESIPAMYIIHVTVAVVINPVPGNFTWIGPDIRFQIGVIKLDTLVNDTNVNVPRTCVSSGPRFARLTAILISGRGGIPIHAPERTIGVEGIIRYGLMRVNPVGLHKLDRRMIPKHLDGFFHRQRCGRERDPQLAIPFHGGGLNVFAQAQPSSLKKICQLSVRDVLLKLDQQLARPVARAARLVLPWRQGLGVA